jgi:hypothetical protein
VAQQQQQRAAAQQQLTVVWIRHKARMSSTATAEQQQSVCDIKHTRALL